jgi:phosphatidylglycerol lysyltransferase
MPHVLSATTFMAGVVLLFSGATPSVGSRVRWLDAVLPLGVIEVSHIAGSLAGAGLIVLAWGLRRRLDAAYALAAALLGVGIGASLLKGLDWEEALVLSAVLALLLPSRRHFYRKAALTNEWLSPGWFGAIAFAIGASIWLGFFSFAHVEYSRHLWWQFTPRGDAPRFLRSTLVTLGALGVVGLMRVLRHARAQPGPPTAADLERVKSIAAASPDTVASLALLGDKALLFSESGRGVLMYGVSGRSWVALGDPMGPRDDQVEVAWRFREDADRQGAWPVFYEVGARNLPLYIDLGLTLLKLGEEARVPLDGFTLEGASRKGLRRTLREVGKKGVTFSVAPASEIPTLLPELRRISDAWLSSKSTREKRFSLGYFSESYLRHFPVALVCVEGRIVAFANVLSGAVHHEMSVDLMRYAPDAPRDVMEYLFVQLMLWAKVEGYRWFNLGMAPFSGLESRTLAPLWHRLGGLVFRHGEHFYNFQGLRKYKQQFDPCWEAKYLASPGGVALPRILANVASLISGGLIGVVKR